MTQEDKEFYKKQCLVPTVGYCASLTGRNWSKAEKRNRAEEENLQRKHLEAQWYEASIVPASTAEIIDMDCDEEFERDIDDCDFQPSDFEDNKYVFNSSSIDDSSDDLPYKYRHIRHGLCSVRPEYYVVMHKLKAEFHV